MSSLNVYKTQHQERKPFDRSLYRSFVFTKTDYRPILSVETMAIVSSNNENIFTLPPEWVEAGNFTKGIVSLIPILQLMGAAGLPGSQPTNAGLIFLQAVQNLVWMPAFFTITYTTGISQTEGEVPVIVNDIIGMTAAINILGAKQAQNKYSSTSINQDGLSQAASGAGTQVYQPRIDQLMERRERLLLKIKAKTHNRYFLSNI
jgi:hypothetical protein